MAQRHHHYEAAFEDFLRSRGWPYVPVNEGRMAIFSGRRVKSFDFIVYPPGQDAWVADVKGRKFPYDTGSGKRYWENWVTREDLASLSQWEEVFGEGFRAVLVFAYWIPAGISRLPSSTVHLFRGEQYAFLWLTAADYAAEARTRSPSWDTLSLPTRTFRDLLQPVGERGPASPPGGPSTPEPPAGNWRPYTPRAALHFSSRVAPSSCVRPGSRSHGPPELDRATPNAPIQVQQSTSLSLPATLPATWGGYNLPYEAEDGDAEAGGLALAGCALAGRNLCVECPGASTGPPARGGRRSDSMGDCRGDRHPHLHPGFSESEAFSPGLAPPVGTRPAPFRPRQAHPRG